MISRRQARLEGACLFFFLIFWIIPLFYLGFKDRPAPWIPKPLTFLHNNFRLFTGRFHWWPVTYLQARFENGEWMTLPEEDYFHMKPFGYRTRLTRYSEIYNNPIFPAHHELADFVRRRYQKLRPQGPPMRAFRILHGRFRVRYENQSGAWVKPPLEKILPGDRTPIFEKEFPGESR